MSELVRLMTFVVCPVIVRYSLVTSRCMQWALTVRYVHVYHEFVIQFSSFSTCVEVKYIPDLNVRSSANKKPVTNYFERGS